MKVKGLKKLLGAPGAYLHSKQGLLFMGRDLCANTDPYIAFIKGDFHEGLWNSNLLRRFLKNFKPSDKVEFEGTNILVSRVPFKGQLNEGWDVDWFVEDWKEIGQFSTATAKGFARLIDSKDTREYAKNVFYGADIMCTNGHYLLNKKLKKAVQPFNLSKKLISRLGKVATVYYSGPDIDALDFKDMKDKQDEIKIMVESEGVSYQYDYIAPPNYHAVIPEKFAQKISFSRLELIDGLRRVRAFLEGADIVDTVIINNTGLMSKDVDSGIEIVEKISCKASKKFLVGLNVKWLIKVLELSDKDTAWMLLSEDKETAQEKIVGIDGHYLMPIAHRNL